MLSTLRQLLAQLCEQFPSVPEEDALRFLVARNFELSKAVPFLQADVDWRESYAPSEVTQARVPRVLPSGFWRSLGTMQSDGASVAVVWVQLSLFWPDQVRALNPTPPLPQGVWPLLPHTLMVPVTSTTCPNSWRCWCTFWRGSGRWASHSLAARTACPPARAQLLAANCSQVAEQFVFLYDMQGWRLSHSLHLRKVHAHISTLQARFCLQRPIRPPAALEGRARAQGCPLGPRDCHVHAEARALVALAPAPTRRLHPSSFVAPRRSITRSV